MTPGARYAAAIGILDVWLTGEPVEKTLSNWARKNRYAGSKDRAAVRDIVFDSLRCLLVYTTPLGIVSGRSAALGHVLANDLEPEMIFSGQGYAPSVLSVAETSVLKAHDAAPISLRETLPDWLRDVFAADLGVQFETTAQALLERAPVDLRVNLGKLTVQQASAQLADAQIEVCPVSGVPSALRVLTNPRRVASAQIYLNGGVELQDAASQAVVDRIDIQPGQKVLDFCAGGGGKTLAMASKQPKAVYAAWDINAARLTPLKERAARAGAKVRLLRQPPELPSFDVVLVDAPCSGSGAWRRNPEGKWRLTQDRLNDLKNSQQEVLVNAARCVQPGGALIYATCSILNQENQAQVDQFLQSNPQFSASEINSFCVSQPGDGFFCAILHKQL